jgi:DNA repair exonuclease SbcCD ATPase subunit
MKIKTIIATDLKGNSFKHNLKDITIFTGPNGAGKSSRLDVVPLAMFGYHPAHKRTNGEILEGLGSGSCMTAAVEFDTGSSISRRWQMNKSTVTCDTQGAIPPSVTPLCIDASEYFGLTERERVKLAFKFSQCATEFGPELVAKVKSLKLEEHDAATEEAIGLVATIIGDDWKLNRQNVSAPEWLETFAEVAKKKCSEAQAGAKRMASTLEGLTELRAQVKQTVNSAAEAQLAELNRELIKLSAKHQAASMKLADARAKYARKIDLEHHIAGSATQKQFWVENAEAIVALEKEIADYSSETSTLRERIAALQGASRDAHAEIARLKQRIATAEKQAASLAEAKALVAPDSVQSKEISAIEKFLKTAKAELEKIGQSESVKIHARLTDAKVELSECSANITNHEKTMAYLDGKMGELSSKKCCPFCEASEDGWQDRVRGGLQKQFEKAKKDNAKEKKRQDDILSTIAIATAELNASIESDRLAADVSRRCEQAENSLRLLKAEQGHALRAISEASSEDIEQLKVRLQELSPEVIDAQISKEASALENSKMKDAGVDAKRFQLRGLRERQAQLTTEQELLMRLRGEFDSLKDITIEAGRALAEEVDRLAAEIANLQTKLQPLTLEVRQANAAKGEVAAKLKAAEAAERVAKEYVVWKEVKKIVDEMQVEAVKESMKPILKQANLIAGSILPSKLEYHDGAIGRWSGRKFIGTRSFNRSDQQIAFAAVSVALASASGSPLKILLMDDLDNVEEKRLKPLFEAIRAAIDAKQISQCIACGVRSKEYAGMEGVEVVEL